MHSIVLGLGLLALGSGNAPPPPAPSFVLEDQFQRPHAVGAAPGDVLVLVYGDRASATANQQLGASLHVHFHPSAAGQDAGRAAQAAPRPIAGWPAGARVPVVRVVPIACAGKVPGVVASLIRSQLRSKSPDLSVLIDFEDRMKLNYGLTSGVSNLVIIDTQGRVRHRTHGPFTQAQLTDLTRYLEQLRVEAKPVSAR